ncbi:MAG: sigma-70 family RNA polymerase sigma factor [Pirellulaceae bacterium]|nr:sigma-70 family RNA polymerase sigma factor [Planctomycetales bacterium]
MTRARQTYEKQARKQMVDQLILDHLDFVRNILGKLVAQLPNDVDTENLESAGVLGLVEAAQQFDPQREVAFKTFAYTRIRGAILDELRRNSPLPQKMMQQIARIRTVCETMPPPITPELLAEKTAMSLTDVEQTLEAMRLSRIRTGQDSVTVLGSIRDMRHERPEAPIEDAELKAILVDSITRLPEKERLVITLYYLEDLRLKEIGEALRLSESRVSRILAKAEFRLSQYVRSQIG